MSAEISDRPVPKNPDEYIRMIRVRITQIMDAFEKAGLKDDARYDGPAYLMLAAEIWHVAGMPKELMLKVAEATYDEAGERDGN